MPDYVVILTPVPGSAVDDARLERVEFVGDRYEERADRTAFVRESAVGPATVVAEFRTSHIVGIAEQP